MTIKDQIAALEDLATSISEAIKNLKQADRGYVVTQDGDTVTLVKEQMDGYQAEADALIAKVKGDAAKVDSAVLAAPSASVVGG